MKYELYVIRNRINNKKYIGITTRGYKRRFNNHKRVAKGGNLRPLYAAIRKYGSKNFEVELLKTVESWEVLCELEKKYIQRYNTFIDNRKGYNLTFGGEGTLGRRLTEEHKQKISKTRNAWSDEKKAEVKEKRSKSVKKYWDTVSPDKIKNRNSRISKSRKKMLKNRDEKISTEINNKTRRTLQQQPAKRKTCTIDKVEYFSLSEASRILSIPIDTIRNRTKSKKYPNYIEGKMYYGN